MITAKEAKALYDASGAEADAMVAKMEDPIRKACADGQCTVFIDVDAMEYRVHRTTEDLEAAKKPVHRQAINKLRELGFTVRFCTNGDRYVPRGLADDDGNGPVFTNYGFLIGW